MKEITTEALCKGDHAGAPCKIMEGARLDQYSLRGFVISSVASIGKKLVVFAVPGAFTPTCRC